MKSWRTTLGGLLAALGTGMSQTGSGGPAWFSQYSPLITIVGLTLLGLTARDNNVPSEAIPGATKTAEKIKGDTAPPFPRP